MDPQQAQRELTVRLRQLYDEREAALIADWVMEHLTGRKRIDRLLDQSVPLSDQVREQYDRYRQELLEGQPVQYVLQESWFCGMKFYVDDRVLIPRPETEELVEWVVRTIGEDEGTLLDVGTGSGCIAIALAKKLPRLEIHACDVSAGALTVAARNAAELNAVIDWHPLNFLDAGEWMALPDIRWLVSNPPYIPQSERAGLSPHVAGAEPAMALFVPDTDPLIFYRALIGFARQKLVPGGAIFVEIHEDLAADTLDLFRAYDFKSVVLRKDMQGKDRMIMASLA